MRTICRYFLTARLVLSILMGFALAAAPGCTDPGNGNNDNGTDNSNNDNGLPNLNGVPNDNSGGGGPDPVNMLVQPDNTQGTLRVGQALADGESEYAMFGTKSGNGTPLNIREVDVILPNTVNTPARILLDEDALPLSIITGDSASLQISYEDLGSTTRITGRFVNFTGASELVTADAILDIDDPGVPDFNDLCGYFENFLAVTGELADECSPNSEDRFCNSTIIDVIDAMMLFCSLDNEIVSGLPPGLGQAPALPLPLGVFADTDSVVTAPQRPVSLRAFAQGGTAPYSFNWTITEGPETTPVDVTPGGVTSRARLSLALAGDYVLTVLLFDDNTDVALFNVAISVQDEPSILLASASSEATDDPFVYDLTATAIGGVTPYSYNWSVVTAPDGGEVQFDSATSATPEATFSEAGAYTLEVRVADDVGMTATARTTVLVVDPDTSLLAVIQSPGCSVVCQAGGDPVETDEDSCVEIEDTIRLTAEPRNVDSCSQDDVDDFSCLEYTWRIIDGQNSGQLTDASERIATLLAVGPERITVSLEIRDPRDDQVAFDQITVEVIECGRLDVMLLTSGSLEDDCDADATLNSPILLRSVTSGFIGLLKYEWVVTSGSGVFGDPNNDCSIANGPCCLDDDSCQNVNFTPTTLDPVTVRVTVTDMATNNTDQDEAVVCASTFTVSIDGPQDGCGTAENPCEILNNLTALFSAVPSDDAPDAVLYEWTIIEGDETAEGSCVYVIESEALDLQLFDCDEQDVSILPEGNGPFTLRVEAQQADDATNDTVAVAAVISACLPEDDPFAIGSAESGLQDGLGILVNEGDTVRLNCLVDSLVARDIEWDRLDMVDVLFPIESPDERDSDDDGVNDDVDLCPETPGGTQVDAFGCSQQQSIDPANFIYTSVFDMPDSPDDDILPPLEFQCHNTNPGSKCDDRSTIVEVYWDAEPFARPTAATREQTVDIGDQVIVVCEQFLGAQASRFDWRQPIGPLVDIMTNGNGTMTFTAPDSPTTLEFDCRGVVLDAVGNELREGRFSVTRAVITVVE